MDYARTVLFTLDSYADNEAGVIFDGKNADKLSPMSPELMTAVRVVKMLSSEPIVQQFEADQTVISSQ